MNCGRTKSHSDGVLNPRLFEERGEPKQIDRTEVLLLRPKPADVLLHVTLSPTYPAHKSQNHKLLYTLAITGTVQGTAHISDTISDLLAY